MSSASSIQSRDAARTRRRRISQRLAKEPAVEKSKHRVDSIMRVRALKKNYYKGKTAVPVLKGVSFKIYPGEFTAIVGTSGSGKSTLLHLMGTLDAPTEGEVLFNGRRIDNMRSRKRDRLRNKNFGMIFQFYHLLPELTMLENVLIPKMIAEGVFKYWLNKRQHVLRAKQLLDMVGLAHRMNHRPNELSGGEMQRTAIARALISKPELLLADEPTGNLDSANGSEIMSILRRLKDEEDLTIIMVTHDDKIAEEADRRIRLVDGKIQQS